MYIYTYIYMYMYIHGFCCYKPEKLPNSFLFIFFGDALDL